MGNKLNSNVTSGIKRQASGETKIYQLLDLKGGGELIEVMKKANRTKNYKELDERIKEGLKPYLYNDGQGKKIHIRDIVKARMEDRGLSAPDRKERDDPEKEMNGRDESMYKMVCCKLEERGAVGETPLHVCLLNATSLHADLAKRLLRNYPKLIYDIYISDMYYGENILHMAIVNEDPAMCKFLLDNGADYHQKACGEFFTPDDQKSRRKDVMNSEWYDMPIETNYEGYTYFGDYPLGFAAILGQEECVRLLIAKGADPNKQDTNGCTVLHLLVVHDKKEMFDLLVSLGAELHVKNRQGLTPLTLAAKLARKDMYEHILEIARQVFWIYGNVTCAAYPLRHIDTISEDTGEINTNSAMYHIVNGDKAGHLSMLDSVMFHLLTEKWKTFAKWRFLRRFVLFCVYFLVFVSAFFLRPGTDKHPTFDNRTIDGGNETRNYTIIDPCYLLRTNTNEDVARLVLEALTLIGAIVYIFFSLKEIYHQGFRIFMQTLIASPTKTLFQMANVFVILMVPGRAACAYVYEDVMGVLAILCTAPYFLFFCRGFKKVGPFVVMIYKMIRTDLFQFMIIYSIFVVGFSQAMYVIFRGVENSRIFYHPIEAMMGMFIMSLGEFADIYDSFQYTRYPALCQAIFVVYMILVTLLLVNMLIAMMGNTYQMVNETQGEWLRQWASIILVIEQTVSTDARKKQQMNYSLPLKDGSRAILIKWHQSEEEKEKNEERHRIQRVKDKKLMAMKENWK